MNVQHIAGRVQLVTLNQSRWSASKLHKRETAKVNDDHHTGDRAKVRVKICDHQNLELIGKLDAATYDQHVAMTRPTIQDGVRMLPVGKALEHADMIREARAKRDALVAGFLADYDDEKARAPIVLNGLYDPAMWPDRSDIAQKFGLTVRYLPCPTDGAWGDWLTESARAATDDLRTQLESAVRRVQERCAGDGKLYDTVFSGLRDLLRDIPDLDIATDSEIRRLAALAAPLVQHDVDVVRRSDAVRHQTAMDAANILDVFATGSLVGV
jgi:hypothetical protein